VSPSREVDALCGKNFALGRAAENRFGEARNALKAA